MNSARSQIKGVVCGVRIEEIEDPLMREIRYLDKLIDELAKGARAVFVVPAMIAGYAIVHGVTHDAIESATALKLLCGTAGPMNLNGFGELAPQV